MYERKRKVDKKNSFILLMVVQNKEMRKDQKSKLFMYCCSFSLNDESGIRGTVNHKAEGVAPF